MLNHVFNNVLVYPSIQKIELICNLLDTMITYWSNFYLLMALPFVMYNPANQLYIGWSVAREQKFLIKGSCNDNLSS